MGLKTIILSMGLATLFALAIMSYMIGFANDNSAAISISDDQSIERYRSGIDSNISNIVITLNESSNILQESEIKSGDENVEGGGQFKTNPYSLFSGIKNIFKLGSSTIFGSDSNFAIVFTLISALIGAIIGLYIWAAWKGGIVD